MWEKLSYAKESQSRFYPTRERLVASYERCQEAGLRREQDAICTGSSEREMRPVGVTHPSAIGKAHALLVDVHRLLVDKSSVLILTDDSSRVLDVHSVAEVVDRCDRIGLKVGASLAERHSGTNAVALALHYREPVILRGHQHFCRVFSDWYCVAAPVVAADGRLVGCVDLSTNRNARLGEKLPLVTTLAAQLAEMLGDLTADAVADVGTSEWGIVSPRQRAILHLLAEGRVAKEIASTLGISQRTVESHLEKLRKRFKAKTTVELIVKLQKDAMVTEPEVRIPPENGVCGSLDDSVTLSHKT